MADAVPLAFSSSTELSVNIFQSMYRVPNNLHRIAYGWVKFEDVSGADGAIRGLNDGQYAVSER